MNNGENSLETIPMANIKNIRYFIVIINTKYNPYTCKHEMYCVFYMYNKDKSLM